MQGFAEAEGLLGQLGEGGGGKGLGAVGQGGGGTVMDLHQQSVGPGGHGVGDYVRVRITGCTPATLFGEEISEG